jgi:protein-L-isoaspartate(D-aspartate) O-methyltransferase
VSADVAARARRFRERRPERLAMLRRQIVARGVRDRRVLAAMARVPRHLFISPTLAGAAYDDAPLPIGARQTISQPYIVALMTAALAIRRADRVLEIGTGSGYQTAILAELAGTVCTVERLPALAAEARERLEMLGYANVRYRIGDGSLGWPEEAPFDGILVAAAAPTVPAVLGAQLVEGGRLVVPVGNIGEQILVVGLRRGDRLDTHQEGPVRFVPLLGAHGFAP